MQKELINRSGFLLESPQKRRLGFSDTVRFPAARSTVQPDISDQLQGGYLLGPSLGQHRLPISGFKGGLHGSQDQLFEDNRMEIILFRAVSKPFSLPPHIVLLL